MIRVDVKPEILRWARERAGLDQNDLSGRFQRLEGMGGRHRSADPQAVGGLRPRRPCPNGLSLFSVRLRTKPVPIPDFRTVAGHQLTRPSPDLLDTIYLCQERQSWYREYARIRGPTRARICQQRHGCNTGRHRGGRDARDSRLPGR